MFYIAGCAVAWNMKKPEIVVESKNGKEVKKISNSGRILLAACVSDVLISVTTLTIGILAVIDILPGISSMGSDALFGIGGSILGLWALVAIICRGDNCRAAGVLIKAGVSSNPVIPRGVFGP